MHYAISHQVQHYSFLSTTPRKKVLKHMLLRVDQGLALLKLGKTEYAVEAGQTVWIPFDSLCSLTFFPNTHIQRIEVSSRVTSRLPKQGGFVQLNELCTALLNRLGEQQQAHEKTVPMLAVFKQELSLLAPELNESEMTQAINHWKVDVKSTLSSEVQLVLKMREAGKRMLSGQKQAQVVADLFGNQMEAYLQLRSALLGE
ncbi:AraC family transcriptional regulator [Vibrio sinensis]|uniref:AraC family transcriptional regulator n=2 Tax=Vibrio sinensis TaxID=2302434 RepID=A0A3A6R080_9VIBR|nr:AraC family transcriptional regulator [Vibrio sinensis]